MRAHAIAAQPAGRRQFQHARKPAVVGEQQEPFGVDVEPADRDDARQVGRQRREHRRSPLRIARGGDEPPGLVEQKEPRALGRGERLAVDAHVVGFAHIEGWAAEHLAVDGDAALGDPGLGVAARTNARPRHDLGDALARADLRGSSLRFVAHGSLRSGPSAPALPRAAACPKPERGGPPNEKRLATAKRAGAAREARFGRREEERRSDEPRLRRSAFGRTARRNADRRRAC